MTHFLSFFALIVLLPAVIPAPAKGVVPTEKSHIYDNYYKFVDLQGQLEQLYHQAIINENYRADERAEAVDRKISKEIGQARQKFSYNNALEVEDIDGFLNAMDSETQRLQKTVRIMKKQ